jgi:hypothetical protein
MKSYLFKGYVRFKDNRYFMGFQWTKEGFEIALNRKCKSFDIGRVQIRRSDDILDGGLGDP